MYTMPKIERVFVILTLSDDYAPDLGEKCKVSVRCSEKTTLLREGACVGQGCAWLLLEIAEVISNLTSGFHARISCIGFSMARPIMRRVG